MTFPIRMLSHVMIKYFFTTDWTHTGNNSKEDTE